MDILSGLYNPDFSISPILKWKKINKINNIFGILKNMW